MLFIIYLSYLILFNQIQLYHFYTYLFGVDNFEMHNRSQLIAMGFHVNAQKVSPCSTRPLGRLKSEKYIRYLYDLYWITV